jgi:hypothetical protein
MGVALVSRRFVNKKMSLYFLMSCVTKIFLARNMQFVIDASEINERVF